MVENNSKHKQKKKSNKNNKRNKKMLFIEIIVLIIILIFVLKVNKVEDIKYKETQIILNNENVTSNISKDIIFEDDKIYMSLEDVKSLLDKSIYKEEETGLIITTSDKKLACIAPNENFITINGSKKSLRKALIEKENEKYLAISEFENVYDYEFEYNENTNIITIDSLNKESIKAYAKKNIKIKEKNKFYTSFIEKVPKGNWVIFISEENGIAKIRTQDGNIGYVKSKLLENFETQRENFAENTDKKTNNEALEYDLTGKDISTFEKREEVINLILQEAIKNDKINVKITFNGDDNFNLERFKIEANPILKECGIMLDI